MLKKYPLIILFIVLFCLGAIILIFNNKKDEEIYKNESNYLNEDNVNEIFYPDNTLRDDFKIEGSLDSALFYNESGYNICPDVGCLKVGYALQYLSKKILGYDIIDGTKILSEKEIEEKIGLSRNDYDSICFLEGNSTNDKDFMIILKVNPSDEDYESKISKAFASLFNYKENLVEIYKDNEIMSTRYLSSKITKGNDYILLFSIGNLKSNDVYETYRYYDDLSNKLLNGYYYVLGEVYSGSNKSEIDNSEDLIENLDLEEIEE